MSEVRTTPVRFKIGPIGLVTADNPYKFVERTANVGDVGEMIVQGELPFTVPDGYVLVKVDDLYAPVDPAMVEVVVS